LWSYHLEREREMDKDPGDMTPRERAEWQRRIASHAAIQGLTVDEFLDKWSNADPDGDYRDDRG
jgi:hypothetical protein